MSHLKSLTTRFTKLRRSPLAIVLPISVLLLMVVWWTQQSNVNSLTRRLKEFRRQVRELPTTVESKNQLDRQVLILQQHVDTLPNTVPQKAQLSRELTGLKQQTDTLSAMVTQKDRLALEQNRLALEQDQLTLQNAVYSSLLQALGGLFFLMAALFAWRYVRSSDEKQIIERFSKAVEQLGNDKQEVRLGGIYALERISKDSEKDYWTVMEVLTSFVHLRCVSPQASPPTESPLAELSLATDLDSLREDLSPYPRDVQAALRVIGRRDVSRDPDDRRIDLSQINLSHANLKGVNFQRVDLSAAVLRHANLREADLSGADLSGADLSGAFLGMSQFKAANLTNASLAKVEWIGGRLQDAILIGADLADADLRGAVLRRSHLDQTILTHTNLRGANLLGTIGLTPDQLIAAQVDEATELPEAAGSSRHQVRPGKASSSAEPSAAESEPAHPPESDIVRSPKR